MQFNIPSSQTVNTLRLEDFLGVDFTTEITDVALNRSPDACNLINVDGYLEKRKGYKTILDFEEKEPINGIWNMDTIKGEIIIVHIGTNLYEINNEFKIKVKIKENLNNSISNGIVFKGKLLIFDGKRIVVYGKFDNQYSAKYLDEIGYIPTTVVSRLADGGGTTYEDVNMIQAKRINSFLGDSSSLNYKLDVDNIDNDEVVVEKLNADANFEVLRENTDFTVDRANGTVKFNIAPRRKSSYR